MAGKITKKHINPGSFAVWYQCSCGGPICFLAEEKQTCQRCQERYQLRVIVGKVPRKGTRGI